VGTHSRAHLRDEAAMTTIGKAMATGLIVFGLVAITSIGTLALVTDSDPIPANVFSTGAVDLGTTPTTAVVTYTNMTAGATITDDVVVSNLAGSSALRYAVSSTATNADAKGLRDQLAFMVKTVDVVSPGTPCDDFDGTPLYSGDLDSSAGKILGDSAQGFHTGDRPLSTGGSETLCFRVTLPIGTGSAFDLATTTATFTFSAEQTVNN
jgi:hypothetical protein